MIEVLLLISQLNFDDPNFIPAVPFPVERRIKTDISTFRSNISPYELLEEGDYIRMHDYFELNKPINIDIITPLYSPWHFLKEKP
jgi:hypothetical protein